MQQYRQTNNSFRLGVKVRLFNYNLDAALMRLAPSRQLQADALGIPLSRIQDWLRFKRYPKEEMRLAICIKLGVPVDSIWPEEIAGVRLEKQPEPLSFTMDEMLAYRLVQPEDNPEAIAIENDMKVQITKVLDMLTDKEAKVLTLRFGLDGSGSKTLEEVSRQTGYGTRSWIRSLETRALHKLKQPQRSRKLREVLES